MRVILALAVLVAQGSVGASAHAQTTLGPQGAAYADDTVVAPIYAQATVPQQDCPIGQPYVGRCPNGDACDDSVGIFGAAELTFMKFMQEGGAADGDGADFGLALAPRYELGYKGVDVGFRSRYWEYDQTILADPGYEIAIDTYFVDLELFHIARVGRMSLEPSAGLRYLEFGKGLYDSDIWVINGFRGFGGTLGLEAKYPFGNGNFYARGRWSLLWGNQDVLLADTEAAYVGTLDDTQSTMTELAFGYEFERCLDGWGTLSLRFGGEWQTWSNMALTGLGSGDILEDVGFAGFATRFEVRR